MISKLKEKNYNGPLSEYILNSLPHRIEAIYNAKYRYIKEIVWDDDANEKYGESRQGYELWKQETSGNISFSGLTDLRTVTNKTGIIGFVAESKRNSNDNYIYMKTQYILAREKLFEILEVQDSDSFSYWLEEYSSSNVSGANEIISAIESFESIIEQYNNDPKFAMFINKIKNLNKL